MTDIPLELAPSSLLYDDQMPSVVQRLLKNSRDSRNKGEWIQAEHCALDALEFCKKSSVHEGQAMAKIHLADLHSNVGELGRALNQCEEAYHIFRRQSAWAQRHNEAVAAYAMGLLHERRLFGDAEETLYWYQQARKQFDVAQEHWAKFNEKALVKVCQQVCHWIRQRSDRIVESRISNDSLPPVFDIWRMDSAKSPFAKNGDLKGYITGDDCVRINGTSYRLHSGSLPTTDTGKAHYYFALRIPEDHWAVAKARAGDYVLVRQQWQLENQVEEDRLGVVWEPGSGWFEVNFKRGRDGKVRFHYLHPRVIGGITPPGDPAGKIKGYITALLKPEHEAFNFAGVVIEGLHADSTLILNERYTLRAGFPKEDHSHFTNKHVSVPNVSPMKIEITIQAPGIEILPDWTQSVDFFPDRDSELAEFTLIPEKVPMGDSPEEWGKTHVEIDFYHQRHWLGRIQFPVKIIDTPRATSTS